MSPYPYVRAVEKNLHLALIADQRVELARLILLAMDHAVDHEYAIQARLKRKTENTLSEGEEFQEEEPF